MKTGKPSVTIAVVAYNEEGNIKSFLESVVAQKEMGFRIKKILVISDGSTDRTVKIVRSLKSAKIEIKAYQARRGKSMRLNEIYASLSTQILIQSDADVIFGSDRVVQEMVKVLTRNNGPALCGGDPTPMPAKSFVEAAVNSTVGLFRSFRKSVGGGNNIFSADGRLLGFRRNFARKVRIPDDMIANDIYVYFICKTSGLDYVFVPKAQVFFRSPQTISDHIRQNTRFLATPRRMLRYFPKTLVESEFFIPSHLWIRGAFEKFLEHPVETIFIFLLNRYCQLRAIMIEKKLTSIWDIATSTKKLRFNY